VDEILKLINESKIINITAEEKAISKLVSIIEIIKRITQIKILDSKIYNTKNENSKRKATLEF
jgi:DNA-binding protein